MAEITIPSNSIKAIIGLGNPGAQYERTRHNIGFRVLDMLAEQHRGFWKTKGDMELSSITINQNQILLIKPQTFMNDSGKIIPYLTKQGIEASHMLVVHDELELPFGQLKFKVGGSHKGHNGLRSIIGAIGDGFARLRFGIGRPERKEDVSSYVLATFKEPKHDLEQLIHQACDMIESLYNK